MAGADSILARSSASLGSMHSAGAELGHSEALRGPAGDQGTMPGSGDGASGRVPGTGVGLGPQVQAGRSCRGCLYFSRSLQDSGREPLCVGITAAETVPAAVFNRHRQWRQQESTQDDSTTGQQSQTQHSHHHHHHHHHENQQQQKVSNFERQQKILEDFRYACIGYSVYPTSPSHAASSASSASSSQPAPPPPNPPSSKPSSSSSATPSSISFLLPAGHGGGSGVQWASFAAQSRDQSDTRHSTVASSVVGLPALLEAHKESPTLVSRELPVGTGAGVSSSSNSSGEASSSERAQWKKPSTPPPLLPICVGIEILAGTKAPERNEHMQPKPHMQPHSSPAQHQPQQGIVGEAPPAAGGAPRGAGDRGLETPPPLDERPPPPWSIRGNTPQKSPSPAGGMTAEEFSRRYIRSARLVVKKCVTNYERLKGAVQSTVEDIFKGDK